MLSGISMFKVIGNSKTASCHSSDGMGKKLKELSGR